MELSSGIPTQPPYAILGEILAPESVPISMYHAELQGAARSFRGSLSKIAYFGFRMRLNDGWVVMGYPAGPKGEEAYREAMDIPRSTWYKAVRIGQALHQLSLEDLTRIPTTNAELLIQVNAAIMFDHQWVREAQTLKPAKFAELVTARNKTVGDDREPLASMIFRVPFLAKKALEGMVDAFQHRHQLSSRGQAFELMVADLHQDQNLLSSVHQAKELLRGVINARLHRGERESEESTWLTMAKELLDEGYEKAIKAARQKQNGVQKTGGRP